jgi:8-oxo-dGTP pyrophosphatase MutT (NUDIX family)
MPIDAPQRFPHLFQEAVWSPGLVRVHFELFAGDQLPEALIANVNLVPRCEQGWLILQLEDGSWEIPGGTLEPGESYIDAIRRELWEEAGAQVQTLYLIGGWHYRAAGERPYRQHLPFPEFYRVVAVGQVLRVGMPTNPIDGEKVVAVECLPLLEVTERFKDQGRDDLAELYELASTLLNFSPNEKRPSKSSSGISEVFGN